MLLFTCSLVYEHHRSAECIMAIPVMEFEAWGYKIVNIFDRSLVEAVQGIALSGRLSCPICSNLRHFQCISSCMHFKTSLDMFKNRIKSHHKHYDMSGHV